MDSNEQCPHEENSQAARLWKRGWNARQRGKDPDHCPASQDPDRNHWINGYTAAQLHTQLDDKQGDRSQKESNRSLG